MFPPAQSYGPTALAEIVSGAISMGIGGFLSAESERDRRL